MTDTLTVVLEIDVTDDNEAALRRLVHLVDSMQPHGSNPVQEFLIEQWGWRYGLIEDIEDNPKVFHSPPHVLRLGPAGDVIIDVLDFDFRTGTWKLLLGDGRIIQTNLQDAQPGLYGPLMTWRKAKRDRHLSELYSIWFRRGYNDMEQGNAQKANEYEQQTRDLEDDEHAAAYNGYRNGQEEWRSKNEGVK